MLHWFIGNPRGEAELIGDFVGVRLKMWTTTLKADLEPLSGPLAFGYARWRKGRVKVSSELARDRWAWDASVRNLVNSIDDVGSTHLGWMPPQVQVGKLLLS